MISYSDFILSKQPWAYCRLDEPVGINIYHDITGNKNHLINNNIEIDNNQDIQLLGDPFIRGIKPTIDNQSLFINDYEIDIPDTSLMFNIPLFKSDSFIYRRREKIQNELSVNSMWIDVILGCDWQSHEDKIKDLLPSFLMSNGQNLKSDLVRQTDIPYNYFIAGANTSVDLYTSPLFFISETFLILAHISLVGVTGVHYNPDGTFKGVSFKICLLENKNIIWFKTLQSVNIIDDPIYQLSNGPHRFTIGLLNSSEVRISIDGDTYQSILISPFTMNHSLYSKIAIFNNLTFSSLSVFFNKNYPSNNWLQKSQLALKRNLKKSVIKNQSHHFYHNFIEPLPGSFLNFINKTLFIGINQTFIKNQFIVSGQLKIRINESIPGLSVGQSIQVNQNKQGQFDGLWRISKIVNSTTIQLSPELISTSSVDITFNGNSYIREYQFTDSPFLLNIEVLENRFYKNDLVEINYITDTIQPHSWVVSLIDINGFEVTLSSSQSPIFNDDCIIKNTPIGGGSWDKIYSDFGFGIRGIQIEASPKNILFNDTNEFFVETSISEINNSNSSGIIFIPKNIKNNFNKEKNNTQSIVIGDSYRFYFTTTFKNNSLSHSQILFFGEIKNYFTGEWNIIASASNKSEKDQNCGFNFAFLYPDWTIDQETGFLVCKSILSQRSDGLINLLSNSFSGFLDSGHHIYPINIPFIRKV